MSEKGSWTRSLLNWYRKNRIDYPWRRTNDPYSVWISEILLQQTRIPVALRYFEKILKRFPTIQHLSEASDQEFLSLWSGIGYYGRARNMLLCAKEIVSRFGGEFPPQREDLMSLPGIGAYTAGALQNICFHNLAPAIDGNIARVLARITNNGHLINSIEFRRQISDVFLASGKRLGSSEYFQALMELGERICTPSPDCEACPILSFCKAFRAGTVSQLPHSRPKRKTESHHWYLLVLRNRGAYYLIQDLRRPFLKGAWIFPDFLCKRPLTPQKIKEHYLKKWEIRLKGSCREVRIQHSVTFRKLTVRILHGCEFSMPKSDGKWLTRKELDSYHTSSVTNKVLSAISASRR